MRTRADYARHRIVADDRIPQNPPAAYPLWYDTVAGVPWLWVAAGATVGWFAAKRR